MIDRHLEPDLPPKAECPKCSSDDAWISDAGGIHCPNCLESFHPEDYPVDDGFDCEDFMDEPQWNYYGR